MGISLQLSCEYETVLKLRFYLNTYPALLPREGPSFS